VIMAAKSVQFTAGEEAPVPLGKPKKSDKTENCEKDFISR